MVKAKKKKTTIKRKTVVQKKKIVAKKKISKKPKSVIAMSKEKFDYFMEKIAAI